MTLGTSVSQRSRPPASRPSPRPEPVAADPVAYPALSLHASKLMAFRVDLELFRGPLDLLLYLVRKHELDVTQVQIARIADQFVTYLEVLAELDFDLIGEFLEVASMLIEIKSRCVLPNADEEEPEFDDQREELVERLLEYKQYKDAAELLQQRGHRWQLQYGRLADDLPTRQLDPAEQPIREVEVWDLVSAFGRIIRDARLVAEPPTIIYDDTPIQVYMQEIHDSLAREQRVGFASIFRPGMHKSALIGMFLAVLELVRHYDVSVEQTELHGEIWIVRGNEFRPDFQVSALAGPAAAGELDDPPARTKPR